MRKSILWWMPLLAGCASEVATTESVDRHEDAYSAARCADAASCCPAGYTVTKLTSGNDSYMDTTPNRCILALAGRDSIDVAAGPSIVFAGPGDDAVYFEPSHSTTRVLGGPGSDALYVSGVASVYGGPDNDTIYTGSADDFVVPGPGADTVDTGAGNDTVAIYDVCELSSGERLQGGAGYDTLILPFEAWLLQYTNTTYDGFENIVVDPNPCKSECATNPSPCGDHGTCTAGPNPGEKSCVCQNFDGYTVYGELCNMLWVSPISCDTCGSHIPVTDPGAGSPIGDPSHLPH